VPIAQDLCSISAQPEGAERAQTTVSSRFQTGAVPITAEVESSGYQEAGDETSACRESSMNHAVTVRSAPVKLSTSHQFAGEAEEHVHPSTSIQPAAPEMFEVHSSRTCQPAMV